MSWLLRNHLLNYQAVQLVIKTTLDKFFWKVKKFISPLQIKANISLHYKLSGRQKAKAKAKSELKPCRHPARTTRSNTLSITPGCNASQLWGYPTPLHFIRLPWQSASTPVYSRGGGTVRESRVFCPRTQQIGLALSYTHNFCPGIQCTDH